MTARRPADQEVRDRVVDARGVSLLVEAGAGTGKTRLLVDRIVGLIERGDLAVPRLAAITYTERAAAELSLRLRASLADRATRAADPDARARLRAALAGIETATIGTIHSFAARLLRERPVEAGIDPAFDVLDEDREKELGRETWEAWRTADLRARPARWARVLAHFRLDAHADGVWSLASSLWNFSDLLAPGDPPAYPDPLPVRDALAGRLGDVFRHATTNCREPADTLAVAVRDLMARAEPLADLAGEALTVGLLDLTVPAATRLGNQKNWTSKDALARARESLAVIGETARGFLAARTGAALADALSLSADFAAHFTAEKKRIGAVGFQDLLRFARDLLATQPIARAALRERWDAILVDEFQDTDPLQTEILLHLGARDPGRGPWADGPLLPGRLFFVGDPKQSIYRFRRADIEVYDRVRRRLAADAGGARVETIHVNFRCVAGILDWVNGVFAKLLGPDVDARVQAPHVPLTPYRDDAPDGPAVTVIPPTAGLDAKTAIAEVRRHEAHVVAQAVRRIVEGGAWRVRDSVTGDLAPAAYRHVAILYPTRNGIEALEDALRDHGVPFAGESGRDFYDDPEVHALVQALLAIETPHDALALASVLAGPLAAFSDDEVVRAWPAMGPLSYADPPAEAAAVPGLADFLDLLRDLHAARDAVPAYVTIDRLLAGTRTLAFFPLRPRGERVGEKLLRLRDRARLLQRERGLTFGETALALARERDTAADVVEESEPDDAADQVQLLTIHKAKGLEFPIVVLANLGSELKGVDKAIPLRDLGRVEVRARDLASREMKTAGYDAAAADEEAKVRAEQVRQLYVAMTRARDHLAISRFAPVYRPDAPSCYLDLVPDLDDLPEDMTRADGVWVFPTSSVTVPDARADRPGVSPDVLDAPPDAWLADQEAAVAARMEARIAGAKVSRRAPSPSRHDAPPPVKAEPSAEEFAGPAIGTAFHDLMERWDGQGGTLEALARGVALRRGMPGAAALLAAWARAVAATAIGERAARCAPADRFVEVPVSVTGEDGRIRDGAVDLVFREGDEWIVVDYKTDRADEADLPALVAYYRPQLAAYADALARVLSRRPAELHLVFARLGRSVRV